MVEMGKECGFRSNFDMPRPFTPRKTELPRKTKLQPTKSPNFLLFPRVEVEVEQRTHSGDEIDALKNLVALKPFSDSCKLVMRVSQLT